MALPNAYASPHEYFCEAIEFLNKYAWVYQHSNTEFIKAGVLDNFPKDFAAYFRTISNDELNEFPLLDDSQETVQNNRELDLFRTKLTRLIPTQAYSELSNPISIDTARVNLRKMNQKKQHEIRQLAKRINELCQHINVLIDFGAGLGYLSEMLCNLSNNKFVILGLESAAERVKAAQQRQQEYMPAAAGNVNYKQQYITEQSLPFISASIAELSSQLDLNQPQIAIIGLHACADLTITAMRLFFDMGNQLQKLIIMPCCYHKMEMNTSTTFRNFPLSQALKSARVQDAECFNCLNRPFLRLACQQTLSSWRNLTAMEHRLHGLEMFRRGVATAIIEADTETISKRKRKMDPTLLNLESFSAFCDIYELTSKSSGETLSWSSQHELKFNNLLKKHPDGVELTEGLTCLQTTMQKLCENIVLYDRLCYMQEYASLHGLKVDVRFEKVLDEKLSPRCYVLIAEKL